MKINKIVAITIFGLIQTAQGGEVFGSSQSTNAQQTKSEINFSYRGIILGMDSKAFILPVPPDEFPNKHLNEQGQRLGYIVVTLTDGDEPCGYGQNNDCFSASTTLSDPELGPSKILAINVIQSYKVRPNFVALTEKLISKYGPARLTHRTKTSVDYVWGGSGVLVQKYQDSVSIEKISGKYVHAHVSGTSLNSSIATGYSLSIVDSELARKNGDLIRKRLMERINNAPKPEDAIKF